MPHNVTPFGFACTLWTARLVVAAWLGAVVVGWRFRPNVRAFGFQRALWTAAAVALLAHTVAAFHFVHGWSTAAAWEHTARRTAEVTGWNWGGGLFVNEALLAWWLFDAAVLWRSPLPAWRRSVGYESVWQGVVGFLMLNATVVFGPPHFRWAAGPAALALIVGYVFRKRRREQQSLASSPSGLVR